MTCASENCYTELAGRVAALSARGGGTLELVDGIYAIDQSLHLPSNVSLCMMPGTIIRALPAFQGEAVIIKDSGEAGVHQPCGWIRGGVIDGGRQPLTGLKVEYACRLDIADLEVRDATFKGIHLADGWYEVNLSHVRCNVDLHTPYAPGSIGIHYEKCGDSQVHAAHIIGYETGVRSDSWSNCFSLVHVWNYDPDQGPMNYCFYCNGHNDTYSQCYADSPTIAGFYMGQPFQSVFACRVYYSRWAADNAGAGVLIGPGGTHGTYIGNVFFADAEHTLGKAYDGNLEAACIIGDNFAAQVVRGGRECRIPSGTGGASWIPPLTLDGTGLRLTPQAHPPATDQGEIGEIRWVDDGESSVLYLKSAQGWKRAILKDEG